MSHKNGCVAASFTLMLIALLLVVSSFMFRDLLDIPRKHEAALSADKRFTLALRRSLRLALAVSALTGRKKNKPAQRGRATVALGNFCAVANGQPAIISTICHWDQNETQARRGHGF